MRVHSIFLTHRGMTMNVDQWAAHTGLPADTIRKRARKGWPVEKVLDPKQMKGLHQRGRKWPAWVKRKISLGRQRTLNGGIARRGLVSLDVLEWEQPFGSFADSVIYADPLELLCALETASARMAFKRGA